MKAMLRDLARRWADKVMIEIADDWQMRSIRAEAKADRLAQALEHMRRMNLANFGARCKAETELEQARVAASAARGDGWDDVVNAGLGMPETRQP